MSDLEMLFSDHIKHLPPAEREYRFHPQRRWRFDFCWPDQKVAVEIEGGTWTMGRHTSGSGYQADCDKYNAAQMLGWQVYRFTGRDVRRGVALNVITSVLAGCAFENYVIG